MYVQYDIRYTHCHFCISTVDLNGSPLNPSSTHRYPPLSLFTFIGPTSQPSPNDFPYIFHAVPMALQAIGPRSKVIGPPGERQTASRWESARCETPATTSWRGKNWSFGAWKSHLIYLYVDLSLSKFIYVDVGFFASTIECYWDLLSIFGRVMRGSLIRV